MDFRRTGTSQQRPHMDSGNCWLRSPTSGDQPPVSSRYLFRLLSRSITSPVKSQTLTSPHIVPSSSPRLPPSEKSHSRQTSDNHAHQHIAAVDNTNTTHTTLAIRLPTAAEQSSKMSGAAESTGATLGHGSGSNSGGFDLLKRATQKMMSKEPTRYVTKWHISFILSALFASCYNSYPLSSAPVMNIRQTGTLQS